MNKGYCQCGCGGETNILSRSIPKLGYLKGDYRRFLLGHATRLSPVDYIVNEETDCWEWQRRKSDGGYGQTHREGRTISAHVYYYEQKYGPVPEGLELDHLCRNRVCCNPDHLEPVTQTVNTRRGEHTKLTIEKAKEIRKLYLSGECIQENLSDLYGVSRPQISRIVNNKEWL